MKTTRLLLGAALWLGVTVGHPAQAVAAPAAPARISSYAVVGYYRTSKPATAVVERALQEIGAKMNGLTPVPDPEKADRVVNVLFTADSYQVNFDGPAPAAIQHQLDTMEDRARVRAMLADAARAEARDGRYRQGK